jgi:hypothetical protein
MGRYLRVNGKIRKGMGMEYNIGLWDQVIKENGKRTIFMVMELLNIQTETFTRVIGLTTTPPDMESS